MRQRFWRYAIVWLLLLASVFLADRLVRGLLLTGNEPRAITPRGELAELERSTVALFEAVSPSVVYIFTEGQRGRGETERRGGAGSGFLWDAAGHVVTNHHVVEGAGRIGVRLDGGTVIEASLVGLAPDHDLAVLRLADNRANLRPIPIGRSAELKIGQQVFAIGNPFGLSRSLTTGIISALDRRLPTASGREIAGVVQTDAAINPGNSGGPLLDSAGRLIGVNTAILSASGQFAGIGFAVPVDAVNRVVPRLIRDGRVPRPGIGISVAPDEVAGRLGVAGLVVVEVLPGSAAAAAGLRGVSRRDNGLGDVILAVNGSPVRSLGQFAGELERAGVGARVKLSVLREGRELIVVVEVRDIGN
ncbi:MAG: trypsin-like serine protease [Alphaproteobacteria bacterium]|nr:trypsin-like serine protease [Alphaproteobacteria bacterium]